MLEFCASAVRAFRRSRIEAIGQEDFRMRIDRHFRAAMLAVMYALMSALMAVLMAGTFSGAAAAEAIHLYTTREPALIAPLTEAFTKKTGTAVKTVFVKDGLAERVAAEGANSPAD